MTTEALFHHRGHVDHNEYGSIHEEQSSNRPSSSGEDTVPLQLGTLDSSDNLQADHDDDPGSGWVGAAFNLTSAIVGAGCIGLGGAIANSGGLVSLVAISVFAVLSKYSFDLVVDLAIESQDARATNYESLGLVTYGHVGKMTVIISKGLYSFGCLVAYMVIVKENFALALSHLLFGCNTDDDDDSSVDDHVVPTGALEKMLTNQYFVTIFFCTAVMLPLSMLRDMTPLERFSALKITVVCFIVVIVIYLFFVVSDRRQESDFVNHWLVIHGGVFESLGTFVFAFAAQNVIHLVYQSLKRSQQKNFSKTTTLGTILSTMISLSIGFFVYMTFWEATTSDIFYLYPNSRAVDMCRILLCISMLLTYPFPFLTVRELLVLLYVGGANDLQGVHGGDRQSIDGTQPLVGNTFHDESDSWLLPGSDRQLKQKYHIILTFLLWLFTLILALGASSLGTVLNLTGCATGTIISYILPALFSLKLKGHTALGSLLFLLGGSVGIVGTYFSVLALFQ